MRLKTGLIWMLLLRTAAADAITSTFGPGDSFTTFGGYQVGGGVVNGRSDEMAVMFTPTSDALLTQIHIAVFSASSMHGDHDLILNLSEGAVPGAPQETFATTVFDGAARIYAFDSVLHPALLAGQTYWIVLSSNDLVDNLFGWNTNDVGFYSVMTEATPRLSAWQVFYDSSPAFEVSGQSVDVDSVPEPNMMLAVGSALLLVGLRHRRPNRS